MSGRHTMRDRGAAQLELEQHGLRALCAAAVCWPHAAGAGRLSLHPPGGIHSARAPRPRGDLVPLWICNGSVSVF